MSTAGGGFTNLRHGRIGSDTHRLDARRQQFPDRHTLQLQGGHQLAVVALVECADRRRVLDEMP